MTNHVPHAAPIARNAGPCNFVAMWNMPGYLPEMEPEFFEHFDDAKRFILNALADEEEQLAIIGNTLAADELSGVREDLNLESGPFCVYWDGYNYSVEAVY